MKPKGSINTRHSPLLFENCSCPTKDQLSPSSVECKSASGLPPAVAQMFLGFLGSIEMEGMSLIPTRLASGILGIWSVRVSHFGLLLVRSVDLQIPPGDAR